MPLAVKRQPTRWHRRSSATIQASALERGEYRKSFRLVGLQHDVQFWPSATPGCPHVDDGWERNYDPAELYPTERWIPKVFEPIRKTFYDGPQPPPMVFMMPEQPLDEYAEVAILLGLHQILGGSFKFVQVFKRLKCVHVYECLHGALALTKLNRRIQNRCRHVDVEVDARMQMPPTSC